MGFIQKKDEKDVLDGIQIIGRGEGPDGDNEPVYDLVAGKTAEDISGTTAAKDADNEYEADPELMDGLTNDDEDEGDGAEPASESSPETPAPAKDDKSKHASKHAKEASEPRPAAKSAAADAANAPADPAKKAKHGVLFIVVAIIAVIAAAIIGYFVGNGGFGGSKGAGTATLTESQLDTPVASWTYNGEQKSITAREAIETQFSLDTVKNNDGTYPTPSADTIVTYVRNQILLADAESRGVSVSDDEMKTYAEQALGMSDYKTMAEQYGVSEDQAKNIVKQQSTIQKLYAQVVPETATKPEAPTEPSDGNQDAASKDYADYIINLAGDEWDKDKGTWAKEGGTYYNALKDQKFTADSATYAQATAAYYAALQEYSEASSAASSKWTEYANNLFAKANLDLYGVYA